MLPNAAQMSYTELIHAFKTNCYKSPELKWRETGELLIQAQSISEKEADFVTRLRNAARRLNFSGEVLHYAVISGLQEPIRLHVLQQGVILYTMRCEQLKLQEPQLRPRLILCQC
jgi:hypothetical protein